MPTQIREFWPGLKRRATLHIFFTELLLVVIVGGTIVGLKVLPIGSLQLWIILTVIVVTSTLLQASILAFASRPAKDLLSAIIHIAGEPTTTTPPNPNDAHYAKNGFKEALQTIYELASSDEKSVVTLTDPTIAQPAMSAQNNEIIASALDAALCGFVVMRHDRTISYYNKSAPISIDQDSVVHLSALFNGSDTLDTWLDDCEQHAVHAEHVWTRVPDRLPEVEGRRLFDVIASYNKDSANETVITLVDRTSVYEVGEQELDFIAFAAHELRGPITVIRGYLDVLEDELDGVLQEDQHELFRRLTVSANRLSGYINNILNTSRYDRRHLKVHLAEDSLSGIYETIRDDMDLRASAQHRLLSVNIPVDLPTIAADRASISEVLGNLIDNAIKYSNEGGAINVTAAAKGDFVEVSVEDHGIGMPGNVVSNLFQKFYRSHRSRETVAGTGIGLYISRGIIESHGGTIGVRSEDGKGSTFTASLPIYSTVADKLASGDNSNEGLIGRGNGWIKNHSMYRG
jgi:signal transduction histidine kinase